MSFSSVIIINSSAGSASNLTWSDYATGSGAHDKLLRWCALRHKVNRVSFLAKSTQVEDSEGDERLKNHWKH